MINWDISLAFGPDSRICCLTPESLIPCFSFLFSKFKWFWWTIPLERLMPSLCLQYCYNSSIYLMISYQVCSVWTMIWGSSIPCYPKYHLFHLFSNNLISFPPLLIFSPHPASQAWSCFIHISYWSAIYRVYLFLWACRFWLEDGDSRQLKFYFSYSLLLLKISTLKI